MSYPLFALGGLGDDVILIRGGDGIRRGGEGARRGGVGTRLGGDMVGSSGSYLASCFFAGAGENDLRLRGSLTLLLELFQDPFSSGSSIQWVGSLAGLFLGGLLERTAFREMFHSGLLRTSRSLPESQSSLEEAGLARTGIGADDS